MEPEEKQADKTFGILLCEIEKSYEKLQENIRNYKKFIESLEEEDESRLVD